LNNLGCIVKTMWFVLFSIAITFLILDFIWIYCLNKSTWDSQIQKIQGSPAIYRPFAAIFVYTIMIFATWYFVVDPNVKANKMNIKDALIPGALLGLAMYGVFDGTNHVMFKDYSTSLAIQDTMYGMFATAIAAAIGIVSASAA